MKKLKKNFKHKKIHEKPSTFNPRNEIKLKLF